MHLCFRLLLTASLVAMTLSSCKKAAPVAPVDPALLDRQMDQLKVVTDALLFPLDPPARLLRKAERAEKITRLQTLLNEEAKSESDAYIAALKANPSSAISAPIPPIRFAKPSGHRYLPELTDVQVEQLGKVVGNLEEFFATQDHSAVFLLTLGDCKRVLREQPNLDLKLYSN